MESMTCAEAEPLLPLVADGAVDPDSDPALFAHLAGCPDCQRAVASHDLIALAITRAPAPRRRASVLRLWPYAAAAGLALVAGTWLLPDHRDVRSAPVAASPSPAPVAPIAQQTASPPDIAREVIAVPRADGTTLYLVRQDAVWVAVDPAQLDGPAQTGHSSAGSVQVRY